MDFRGSLEAFRQEGYDFYFTVERKCGEAPEREIGNAVQYLKQLRKECQG